MEDFDIMNDVAIARRLKKQQELIWKARNMTHEDEHEIIEMLAHDKKLIEQYLKLAKADSKPLEVYADGLSLNVGTDADNYRVDAAFECWRSIREVVVTYSHRKGFSFHYEDGTPCTNLVMQYVATEDLTDCLENQKEVLGAIDKAVGCTFTDIIDAYGHTCNGNYQYNV